ncbi:hypothetical protein ACIA71_08485 [Streptomyces anulatus]|uniref:hypothetical protein n=1 Tax=Streptomyces anulatus TaxID=1892 RepID=UPI0036611A81|nr:hypothetical protein OG536_27565 [Streptomyces anulatus]
MSRHLYTSSRNRRTGRTAGAAAIAVVLAGGLATALPVTAHAAGTAEAAAAGGYTWRLTATPSDGTGADATASGTLRVTG